MNEKNKQNQMIEIPEAWKTRGEGEVRPVEVRTVGRGVVAVARDAGRYNNGVVEVPEREGIPIAFPGHDTIRAQARSFSDTTAPKERPTEHDADEV